MGKLTIEGNAKRVCHCDVMKITVDFRTHETSTAEALEKVMNQCEEFLSVLNENGIDIENIVLGDTSVVKGEYRYQPEGFVCGTRKLVIYSNLDIKFMNYIMLVIKDKKYDANVDFNYRIKDVNKIHKELLKEAVLDSKTKAEAMAETVGQKITGIDVIKNMDSYNNRSDFQLRENVRQIATPTSQEYSDRLKSPVSTEEEKVTVTWIVE